MVIPAPDVNVQDKIPIDALQYHTELRFAVHVETASDKTEAVTGDVTAMVFVQIGLLLVGEKEVAGRLGIMILGIQEVLVSPITP